MLDREKNKIPEKVEHIHIIAICGTAMGALAAILKDMGFKITGSDQKVYPPISTFLKEKNIEVSEGFDPDRILDARPDLVVVGNAVTRNNPEALALAESGLFYCSLPQALNYFFLKDKKALLIAGTHGKTTSTSLLAWILEVAGLSPSFMIGGIARNFNSNYRSGKGPYLVLEADEYDTAFFDKGSKFLHFTPFRTLITSLEFDHADIFSDFEAVKQTFYKLMLRIPEDALLSFSLDYPAIKELSLKSGLLKNQIESFSVEKKDGDWTVRDLKVEDFKESFSIFYKESFFMRIESRLLGRHNRANILGVIALAHSLGISGELIAEAVKTFKGVRRRQEILGSINDIRVVDDFAHHPTAVRETIKALKPHVKGRLIAVFEPRSNSSMRNIFQQLYAESFDEADLVCIRKLPFPEKVPEKERLMVEKLVEDIKARGVEARLFENADAIIAFSVKNLLPHDLVLVMSNGAFEDIHSRLLKALESLN